MDKEQHWDRLSEVCESLDQRNPKVVIGDCNARLHGRRDYERVIVAPVLYGRGIEYLESCVPEKFQGNS